ncbi:hypothetical protein GGX14DRAFT_575296 [Mycena pura]|uniref:Uncharacterized protein n=1 Tax=Mycena pura TaxID=153505 RepID=A0AAD6UZ70_9AGAR|nr:hypothetical protein GGX14DRAFT_575296 [Mycena pura]
MSPAAWGSLGPVAVAPAWLPTMLGFLALPALNGRDGRPVSPGGVLRVPVVPPPLQRAYARELPAGTDEGDAPSPLNPPVFQEGLWREI